MAEGALSKYRKDFIKAKSVIDLPLNAQTLLNLLVLVVDIRYRLRYGQGAITTGQTPPVDKVC